MSRTTTKPTEPETHRCQWLDCENIYPDAESLYEHITSLHIGRKSAGTLSLDCHWAGCSSKATKRDHLTSHARVHINLKPHTCDVCSKSFKRPQDLKKHEKIHTEEHHAHHKHSKAVVGGNAVGSSTSSTLGSHTTSPPPNGLPMLPPNSPYAAGFQPSFPGYPYFGQHPLYPGQPQLSHLDVAQIIEHQRQLNHVVNVAYSLPGLPSPYGLQYPAPGTFPNPAHQLSSLPMFSPGLPAPYPFPYFHPGAGGFAGMPHHIGLPAGLGGPAGESVASTVNAPSVASTTSSPASAQPLYPSLSNLSSTVESTNNRDGASSPASHRSPYSSHSASSLSPKVPSLSPASLSNGYSPSPEQDNDSLFRPTNAVAGQKRTFEDAAGDFFNGVKNKRFQEGDYASQIDSIDALALLLNPSEFTSNPSYHRPQSPQSAPEFNRADVENINDILANLAQNIDEYERTSTTPPLPQQHVEAAPAAAPVQGSSMYPSLNTYDRLLAPLPSRHANTQSSAYYDPTATTGLASIRVSKSTAAPSIAPNDTRQPTYHSIERLTKAAPISSYHYRSHRLESMDIDDEAPRKAYSTSLRSTSLDVETSDDTPSRPSTSSSSTSSSSTTLSPLYRHLGPTLPPISLSNPLTPTTLPPIRDMLSMRPRLPSIETSRSSSVVPGSPSSRSSTSSSSGMERLVPEFTQMGMKAEEEEDASALDSDGESTVDGMSEDEGEDQPSLKRTRVASPEPMETEEDTTVSSTTALNNKRRTDRLAVVRWLALYINEMYRKQMTAKVQARQPAPPVTVAPPSPAVDTVKSTVSSSVSSLLRP